MNDPTLESLQAEVTKLSEALASSHRALESAIGEKEQVVEHAAQLLFNTCERHRPTMRTETFKRCTDMNPNACLWCLREQLQRAMDVIQGRTAPERVSA